METKHEVERERETRWCVANRKFLMTMLGRRGGWRVGDRFLWHEMDWGKDKWVFDAVSTMDRDIANRREEKETFNDLFNSFEEAVWFPTCDDAIELLGWQRLEIWNPSQTTIGSYLVYDKIRGQQEEGSTLLIALLYLLKTGDWRDECQKIERKGND